MKARLNLLCVFVSSMIAGFCLGIESILLGVLNAGAALFNFWVVINLNQDDFSGRDE